MVKTAIEAMVLVVTAVDRSAKFMPVVESEVISEAMVASYPILTAKSMAAAEPTLTAESVATQPLVATKVIPLALD